MPVLKIQTNKLFNSDNQKPLLEKASRIVAQELGKPEKYVMGAMESNPDMLFSGNDEPLAYLELKSIGLPEQSTGKLSQALCSLIHQELDITMDRIYIEFSDAKRTMWGWNGATF